MEILREEISSLQTVKSKLQEKVKDQEVDIKKMREELEKKNNSTKDEEEVFKYILNFLGILEGRGGLSVGFFIQNSNCSSALSLLQICMSFIYVMSDL